MPGQQSIGTCLLCHGTFSKTVMTRHLKACRQQRESVVTPAGKRKAQATRLFHLVVDGTYLPMYWLHFEAKAKTTLGDLDDFLRDIWLECCGHMSAFTIEGVSYTSGAGEGWLGGFEEEDEGMDGVLGEVLQSGLKFSYEYDFGTTTDLTLRVVGEREGNFRERVIRLLARNEAPEVLCEVCGKKAMRVCSQCIFDGEGWLCSRCARKHECGEEMLLPVVNSPRVGMCAYEG